MSEVIIRLNDRSITDKGEVVCDYDLLFQRLLSGKTFHHPTPDHPDVRMYNQCSGTKIPVWKPGEFEGPDDKAFRWKLPAKYATLDVEETVGRCFFERSIAEDDIERYAERLAQELTIMKERRMYDLIRCLIYIRDTIHDKGHVLGIGRGSSCASLVLFILDINKVDPVKYDIPITEFLK